MRPGYSKETTIHILVQPKRTTDRDPSYSIFLGDRIYIYISVKKYEPYKLYIFNPFFSFLSKEKNICRMNVSTVSGLGRE